jgi:hypothetical protein
VEVNVSKRDVNLIREIKRVNAENTAEVNVVNQVAIKIALEDSTENANCMVVGQDVQAV